MKSQVPHYLKTTDMMSFIVSEHGIHLNYGGRNFGSQNTDGAFMYHY